MTTQNNIDMLWLMKELLEHSPDAFGVFDSNDRLVLCNQNMANIWSLSKDQALGKSHTELIKRAHEFGQTVNIETEDIDEWIADIRTRQRTQKYRVFESDWRDGTWIQVSELLLDNQFMVVSTRDITELKQTQIKLQQALEHISKIASIDELTQIFNRRSFNERAEAEVKRCQRYRHPLSLLLLDIDHFKNVNDTYGHANGDLVLQAFAQLFKGHLRDSDVFARFGGEEFALVLPETNISSAEKLTNRLSKLLAQQQITAIDSKTVISITVSSGLTALGDITDNLENMLIRADKALYESKQNGRNRCTIAR